MIFNLRGKIGKEFVIKTVTEKTRNYTVVPLKMNTTNKKNSKAIQHTLVQSSGLRGFTSIVLLGLIWLVAYVG